MKMYLDESQTAKLIELGLEKPKSVISYSYPVQSEEQQAYEASLGLDTYLATVDQIEFEYAYSIGELIEMLGVHLSSIYYIKIGFWVVNAEGFEYRNDEFIDALYDMVIKLKEEGII